MARTYDVYGVGHALVDIQYQVAPEFLAEHQVEKGIMTLVDEARQRNLTAAVGGEPVASASGGSAANTLIGVARFGGLAYYACLTGRDAWGDFYQRDLEAAGVATHPANRGAGKTGQCLVFITPDADRTLNTFLGISSAIGPGPAPRGGHRRQPIPLYRRVSPRLGRRLCRRVPSTANGPAAQHGRRPNPERSLCRPGLSGAL